MAGKLDDISRAIGSLETSVRELQRRMDENRELQAHRHDDNAAALRELSAKLDQHAEAVEMIRPTVAALEMSRSKIATWASVGFAVVVLGCIGYVFRRIYSRAYRRTSLCRRARRSMGVPPASCSPILFRRSNRAPSRI